ncbi:MAG: hypothetical protein K0S76_1325 [Herbinix sp.]|jgi:hypothetical protein|nr:hypothetical protein [Herbinix sp.]
MIKLFKGSLLIGLIVAISFLMPGLIDNMRHTVEANDAGWSEDGEDPSQVYDFTIVEIVPHKALGEINYLVDGEEHLDRDLHNELNYNSAEGSLNIFGDAFTIFNSYTERPTATSGSDWRPAKTIITQNGYFIPDNDGIYKKTSGEHFVRAIDNDGDYRVELKPGADMETQVYSDWNATHKKNVKAYFVYGYPTGVDLYNSSNGYEPFSVNEIPDRTGDYDYDLGTRKFKLNKGHGRYDVLFKPGSKNTTNTYHMTADYEIMEDATGPYSFPVQYVLDANGAYERETGTRFDFNEWNGDYTWVQDAAALQKTSTRNYVSEGNKIWVRGQKIMSFYQYKTKTEFINNEWFKRLALNIPASQVENFKVRVITITPEELNKPENQHYIDEAGMFYINSLVHNSAQISLYETYSYEGTGPQNNPKYYSSNPTFLAHDLSWTSVIKLFRRAAGIGCHKAGMVFDHTTWSENTICNVSKLFLMVNQRNMVDFYNSFLNPDTTDYLITEVNTSANTTGSTGSFIRPDSTNPSPSAYAALYWNENTFLPYGLNENGEMVRFTEADYIAKGIFNYDFMAETTDLTYNILVTNGQEIFNKNFAADSLHKLPDASSKDAKEHLAYVNPDGTVTTPSRYTIADIVHVITNGGAGYENVGGISYPDGSYVEGVGGGSGPIPPDDGSGDTDVRYYKRILNIQPTADFTESEAKIRLMMTGYPIQIVNMTSIQFNGSIEDINSRYDMILIGSGAGRFYDDGTKTAFNNTTMNGMIYFSQGDYVTINDGVQARVNYPGNDISLQRKEDLISFLKAGYPIVLDKYMYECDTNPSLSKKVQSGTNIRAFVTLAKAYTANCLNLDSFLSSSDTAIYTFYIRLQFALNINRPNIRLEAPIITTTEQYRYADSDTKLYTIRFKIPPKGLLPSIYTYNAYLYIDKDGDGIFDPEEKVNVRSDDGSAWEGLRESNYRTYTYKYDMSNLNGVYQWKVVIERQGKKEIRQSLTGYASNTENEKIYVLQLMENDGTGHNLQTKVDYFPSQYHEYARQGLLMDYDIIFETKTVLNFVNLYTTQPYTSGTAEESNQLSKYHLIILDNPVTIIPETNGAAANIRDEIDNHLGVIFTKNALGFARQDAYYNQSTSHSFTEQLTYNRIHRYVNEWEGSLLQKYMFRNLGTYAELSQDSAYQTNFLTKTNEGPVTRYPYQIDEAILIAHNSYSNNTTLDFHLQNKRLIGWYSLSDTKSPVIRRAGLTPDGAVSDLYQGVYSSSPNDVKNNYYLFSNGSTYYSGINLAAADQPEYRKEVQLFVNTIIAAFQSTGRVIKIPPRLEFFRPVSVEDEIHGKVLHFTQEDRIASDFILIFTLNDSLTDMELEIFLNGLNPTGSWNETIYAVSDAGVISNTPIPLGSETVATGTYAIKIPESVLVDNDQPRLRITAENEDSDSDMIEATLLFAQDPVVTITDSKLITNGVNQVIYVDFDYNAVDSSDYNSEEELRIAFTVEQEYSNISLQFTSTEEGLTEELTDMVRVCRIRADGTEQTIDPHSAFEDGEFVMYVPNELMQGKSSRDITITATDETHNTGEVTVTLLRRSLFPLD